MKPKRVNTVRTPIYRDAGFELYDAGTTAETFSKETLNERDPDLYIYSRYRNPTVEAAETAIIELERSEWALLTQTGMSAIDIALSVFQKNDDKRPWLFFSEIYGGTISYVEAVLKARRGADCHYFNAGEGRYDLSRLDAELQRLKPSVLYVETVSNPMLIVADIPAVIVLAARYGTRVVVDNTFATPLLFRPLEHGADLVIHSATKYFSGHGNLTAGVICGSDHSLMQAAVEYRKFTGHMISPDDAYRLQTQMKTLNLRFARQCSNAAALASLLSGSAAVGKTWFPGLPAHPSHEVAERIFGTGSYGAMITFDLAGENGDIKRKRRDDFIRRVSGKIMLIPTLGDPHTILMPVEAVWGTKYPEPGMIRLSVGYEDYKELEATIVAALESL